MANASDVLETQIITHLFRSGTWPKPGALYIALAASIPYDSGLTSEISGAGYARVRYDPGDGNWTAPTGGNGQTSNINLIDFGVAGTTWGTIRYAAIMSALTGGDILAWASLATSRNIYPGDGFIIAPGDLVVTFA